MADHFPRQIFKAARVALNLSTRRFSQLAKVSTSTLFIVETTNNHVATRTIEKIGKALEQQGIEFFASEPGKGPGFRLPPVQDPIDHGLGNHPSHYEDAEIENAAFGADYLLKKPSKAPILTSLRKKLWR